MRKIFTLKKINRVYKFFVISRLFQICIKPIELQDAVEKDIDIGVRTGYISTTSNTWYR